MTSKAQGERMSPRRERVASMRRVHRLTPLLRFWSGIVALVSLLVVNIDRDEIRFVVEHQDYVFYAVGAVLLSVLVVWAVSGLWWKSEGFDITEQDVIVARGVFNAKLRSARRDRIQAVDIVESVIARIFRVVEVRVETAGGRDSVLTIGYLTREEGEAVRRELLGEPVEHVGEHIQVSKILLGTALTHGTWLCCVGLLFLVPGGAAAALPFVVGIVPSAWGVIDKGWKFRSSFVGDAEEPSIHVSYGLADRRKQSIPLSRIHAVEISQPALWRFLGWWRVRVSVVGYGVKDKKAGTTTLLPVGTLAQAMGLVNELTGISLDPRREGHPTFISPRRARWISPLDVSNQTVKLFDGYVSTRFGWLRRRAAVVETAHIQELSVVQGPIQRLLGLRTVRLDLVTGPVLMQGRDLDEAQARELVNYLRGREFNVLNELS
ncbi:Bacterial membrane flanked domain [Corynebacterium ulcerans]|nr:Bacterial membrane flanked domain [Corynebacterium ulcerans]